MTKILALVALLLSISALQAMNNSAQSLNNTGGQTTCAKAAIRDVDMASNLYINIMNFLDNGEQAYLTRADEALEKGAKPFMQFSLNKDGVDISISVKEAIKSLAQDLENNSFNHDDFDVFKTTTQEKPSYGALLQQLISQCKNPQQAEEIARERLFNRFLATGKLKREGLARLETVITLIREYEQKRSDDAQKLGSQTGDKPAFKALRDDSKGGRAPRGRSTLARLLFFAGAGAWFYFLYHRFYKTDKSKSRP